MAKDPLHTKLCEMLGIEFPIVAFTHCKDVAAAVINAGAFAVLGEGLHNPDEIAADVRWMRERVGSRPFGVDLLLPGLPRFVILQDPQGSEDHVVVVQKAALAEQGFILLVEASGDAQGDVVGQQV